MGSGRRLGASLDATSRDAISGRAGTPRVSRALLARRGPEKGRDARPAGTRLWGPALVALCLLWTALAGGAFAAPAPQGAVADPGGGQAPGQTSADEPLVNASGAVFGHHYRQTGSGTGAGYDLREPFFSASSELGGVSVIGYPASAPFRGGDGCTYQIFQVLLLQDCPGQPIRLANTFQILEEAGADPQLEALGIGRGWEDGATSFAEATRIRLSWLEEPAILDRFLTQCGAGDQEAAVQRCGLPMNPPQRVGPFVSQRFQRIAFQRWLVDGPAGIDTGDVTPVLGGDLLKSLGVVSGPAVQPHRVGQPPALGVAPFGGPREASPAARTAVPAAGASGGVAFQNQATLSVLQTLVETSSGAASADAFRPARDGEELAVGDAVRTDTSGRALLTFYEGTTAEVLPASLLVVERLETNASGGNPAAPVVSLRQLAGQVIHRLTRTLLPGAVYEVRTPSASAVVRGTVLQVSVATDGGTRIEVFQGSADVTGAGVTVVVPAGALTEVAPGQPPAPAAPNPSPPPALDAPPVSSLGPVPAAPTAAAALTTPALPTAPAGAAAATEATSAAGAAGAVATSAAETPAVPPIAAPTPPPVLPGNGAPSPVAGALLPPAETTGAAVGTVAGTTLATATTVPTRAPTITPTRTPTPTASPRPQVTTPPVVSTVSSGAAGSSGTSGISQPAVR